MAKAYQQNGPYIPRNDEAFASWALNFARLISENPGGYGLCEQDAQIIMGLAKHFMELYQQCQSSQTRTSALVARKDAIRASAEGTFRTYAGLIRANKGVTNADKVSLGLHVPDPTRTRIGPPTTAPMLTIPGLFNGSHMLRYADESTPNSRRKPHGVANLHLWMVISDTQTHLPQETMKLVGIYTRCPIIVEHEVKDAGKTASYFGRWVTKRGLMGPWSLPAHMMIAFGGKDEKGDAVGERADSASGQPLKMAA